MDILKKNFGTVFNKHGLGIPVEANIKVVDFLDVIFYLENDTYKPFIKPNNTLLYVHMLSNNLPSLAKNILHIL